MSKRLTINTLKPTSLTIQRAASVISTELDNETIILDTSSGKYSGLDLVGTTIWEAIEHSASFSEIVKIILAEYLVTEEDCVSDLIKFLNKLAELNLIVIHGSSE